MLKRRSLRTEITRITAPTLFLVAEGGQEGWTIADAEAAAATMSNATAETLPGTGNVGPLVVAPARSPNDCARRSTRQRLRSVSEHERLLIPTRPARIAPAPPT